MAVKTVPGKQWGNNGVNANDAPDWQYVADASNTPQKVDSAGATRQPAKDLYGNASANIVHTVAGWELEYPDGLGGVGNRETLVAIGGLTMPALTVLFSQDVSGVVSNTTGQFLKVRVQLSSGAIVDPTALANVYIVAIGDDVATANVNLAYSDTLSAPESGVLVFVSPSLNLAGADTNSAYTVNSTSTFHGDTNVSSRKKKGPALLLTSALPNPGTTILVV